MHLLHHFEESFSNSGHKIVLFALIMTLSIYIYADMLYIIYIVISIYVYSIIYIISLYIQDYKFCVMHIEDIFIKINV